MFALPNPVTPYPPQTPFIMFPLACEQANTVKNVMKGLGIQCYELTQPEAECAMDAVIKKLLEDSARKVAMAGALALRDNAIRDRKRSGPSTTLSPITVQSTSTSPPVPPLPSPSILSGFLIPSIAPESTLPTFVQPSNEDASESENEAATSHQAAKRMKKGRSIAATIAKIEAINSGRVPKPPTGEKTSSDGKPNEVWYDHRSGVIRGTPLDVSAVQVKEESLPCQLCPRKFTNSDDDRQRVRYHVLQHSLRARPYFCPECDYDHFELGKVKRHIRYKHRKSAEEALAMIGDRKNKLMEAVWAVMIKRCFPEYDVGRLEIGKPWKTVLALDEVHACDACGEEVPTTLLLVHIVQHHLTDRLYYCTQCTKIFLTQEARSAHSLSKHNCEIKDQPAKIDISANRDDDVRRAFFPRSME